MKKAKVTFDIILFGLLMILLFLPLIQKKTNFFPLKPLKGVFEATEKPTLTFDSYKNCTYQAQIEKYVSENFGFREPVIRLYNQYVYSFFNKTYCHFIVPGKDGHLFYDQAVNDYYGTEIPKHFDSNEDFMAKADQEVALMKQLREMLHQHGIEFMTFMAPDKPYVYPEYMPRRNPRQPDAVKSVEYYDQKMTKAGIPHIEMTKWYQHMKDTASFDIFTKTDSHWRFSSTYGYDSLFRYMNRLNNFGIPKIHIGPVQSYTTDKLEGDEETLNLIFPIKGTSTKYKADITIECDSTTRKPRVLFVGDSFIWSLEEFLPWRDILQDVEVWFYNSTAYVGFEKETFKVKDLNRLSSLLNADYVIYYSAGHQWWQTSYGFLEDAIQQLNVPDSLIQLTRQMNAIRNDKHWKKALQIQASMQETSFDQVLQQEANNVICGNPLLKDSTPMDKETIIKIEKEKIENTWRNSTKIMNQLKEKAKNKGISVDSMLKLDIQWVINKKIEKGELVFEDEESMEPASTDTASIIKMEMEKLEKKWRADPETMKKMTKKANSKSISIDSMIKLDQQWVINQKIKNGELFNK